MNHLIPAALVFLAMPATAGGGLDGFISNLNVQARADMNGFSAKVAMQFGVPEVRVRAVLGSVREPADAFMVFQLGRMGQCPPERVMEVYKTRHGQGWGAMAKELGIKPGSAEFHALKRGDLRFDGRPQGGQGKGKDKEHGKGHGKGRPSR